MLHCCTTSTHMRRISTHVCRDRKTSPGGGQGSRIRPNSSTVVAPEQVSTNYFLGVARMANTQFPLTNHECFGSMEEDSAASLGKNSCTDPIIYHTAGGKRTDIRQRPE